jgi:hypothetical protein
MMSSGLKAAGGRLELVMKAYCAPTAYPPTRIGAEWHNTLVAETFLHYYTRYAILQLEMATKPEVTTHIFKTLAGLVSAKYGTCAR